MAARGRRARAARIRDSARDRRRDQRRRLHDGVARRRSPRLCVPKSNAMPPRLRRVARQASRRWIPPGVGARSVGECIELQLRQLDPADPGIQHGASRSRDTISSSSPSASCQLLRRELRATEEEIACALALVRSCHPRPGSTVSTGAAEYVVPDVFVRRTDHGWAVEINAATLPRVRLNQQLCEPDRPQCEPCDHARAVAGGPVAAEEPGDPPRDADQGRPLHCRAAAGVPRAWRRTHAADDPEGHRRSRRACTSRPSRA